MPGFTGEVSLEPAVKQYASRHHTPERSSRAAVLPQLIKGLAGPTPFNPYCWCVSGEDCPCDNMDPELFLKAR